MVGVRPNYWRSTTPLRHRGERLQLCLVGEWDEFSETLPRSGMMRNGSVFQLPPLVRLTGGGSGLWPTPITADAGQNRGAPLKYKGGNLSLTGAARQWPTPHANCSTGAGRQGRDGGDNLQTAVAMWPTPTGRDWKDGSAKACANVPSNGLLGREVFRDGTNNVGSLNPAWVEFLMGLPTGFTDLKR